jgi:predicted ATPase
MITNMRIENFKPIKKIETSVKGLNLLMGINGMGKTSFIQTLLLLMQSDKLENRIIELNGNLAKIGLGRDALYQFAKDDFISFGITLDQQSEYFWKFAYKADKDELLSQYEYTKDQMELFRQKTNRFQYINTNRIGPQDLYEASSTVVSDKKQLGLLGEYAAYYINMFGSEYVVSTTMRHPSAVSEKLLSQINAWLSEISRGVYLNTRYIPEINKVMLDYQFEYSGNKTNSFLPKNVGFGISYILPVVLALLTAEKDKIIVIENPESHIHPRGQAEMGKLIARAAQNGAQLFIETHSDHILNGIRVAVKEELIDKDNVNILFFDKETTESEQYAYITPISIDKNGSLSDYPENFLDEWSNQLSKLI